MKLKQLLASALLVCSSGAWAQTDVTSTYITNAGFESCTAATGNQAAGKTTQGIDYTDDGWVFLYDQASETWSMSAVLAYGSGSQINGAVIPNTDNLGNTGNALGVSVGWGHSFYYRSATAFTLPAGHYELKVYAYNNLNGVTQFRSLFGFVPTSGASKLSSKTSFAYATWETDVVSFDLTEETEGKIQIGGQAISGGSGANAKVFFDNITLVYTDPLKASKDALQAEIDKAKLCDAKEGLADAISTAEGVLASATTTSELDDALAALQAADKDAVLRYENGLADATALDPVATSFVVNGTFDSNVNGWNRTGGFQNNAIASNQNGAFTVPFYENWNGSAKVNKMYQTISNIPNGTYRLDIAAFVNTLADPNESQYVFANSDKVYLTTGEPTAYEVYTVVTNNQIEIGLEQTTATANWMGIDNVSLRYYGAGDVIEEAKTGAPFIAAKDALQAAIDAAPAVRTANIGDGVFQIAEAGVNTYAAAVEAANAALADGAATLESLATAKSTFVAAVAAYNALEVNAPADGQLFTVSLASGEWTAKGINFSNEAMTFIANDRADAGLYNIQYKLAANTNLAQAFTFTKVEGNNYKMSQIDADDNVRYICTGVPYSGNPAQIRTTTNADDALVVTVIPTATEGKWNLWNTEANQYIGAQDAGVYTVNSHIDFAIAGTTKPSIAINTSEAGWGTTFLPFAVATLPTDVKAYTCEAVDGNTLTLVEVDALEANKPYIIEGSWNEILKGDAQGTELTHKEGLLTGTYAPIAAPNGSYILQNQNDNVGFYLVNTAVAQPNVPANRAYLTVGGDSSVKAFFLNDTATGINGVMNEIAAGKIYDLGGRKVSKMQKGQTYIVGDKKVTIK